MPKVLCIDSSSRSATSVTRQLTEAFMARFKSSNPTAEIMHRDLIAEGISFVSDASISTLYTPAEQRTPTMAALYEQLSVYADEVVAADLIILGAPMYNFTVPAALKAYIDMIVFPGKTFAYDGGAPVAMLAGQNKKIIVFTASGGNYDELPYKAYDFLDPYLRAVFAFIGIPTLSLSKCRGTTKPLCKPRLKKPWPKLRIWLHNQLLSKLLFLLDEETVANTVHVANNRGF
ncbi:MAG: NAD(P)H-dependent oxidoreductase [Candidatus Obscuribacterales bacterium]